MTVIIQKTKQALSALASDSNDLHQQINESYQYSHSEEEFLQEYNNQTEGSSQALFLDDNRICMLAYFQVNSRQASYWGRPIKIFWATELSLIKKSHILKQFLMCLFEKGATKASFLFDEAFKDACYYTNYKILPQVRSYVDLNLDEEIILKGVRKSYRSLINWGKRELRIDHFTHENISPEVIMNFQQFHLNVAGRRTRSNRSWEIQYNLIKKKQAFITMAYLDFQLVSSNFIFYGSKIATYGVAVNDRDLMAKKVPVGHWPLLYSIFESKKRGLELFDLGVTFHSSLTSKEISIGRFKEGFSDYRVRDDIIEVNLNSYLK